VIFFFSFTGRKTKTITDCNGCYMHILLPGKKRRR